MHLVFLPMTDESSDSSSVSDERYDPPDAMDIHSFDPTPANPNWLAVDDALGTQEGETNGQPNTVDQETASAVFVDQFPFGSLGDPIAGKVQGSSAYETR